MPKSGEGYHDFFIGGKSVQSEAMFSKVTNYSLPADPEKPISFPDGPSQDERIERIAKEADTDAEIKGYVTLIVTVDDGISFKFGVPESHSLTDEMIGALDRVRHRLIQYQEGERER